LGLHDFSFGKQSFHFESFWLQLDGFLGEVQRSWEQRVDSACPLQTLANKLDRISRDLLSWGHRKTGHIKQELQFARELLHQLEIAQDFRVLTPLED
jgi:hypothetical protein